MSATPNVKVDLTESLKVDLTQNLKSFHLPTIGQCYEEVARQAEREALSYERYLHELVQRECEERQENRTTKMLRKSQLPLENPLEAFDTRRLPAKAARQMRTLLDGGFLDRAENALVFGNPDPETLCVTSYNSAEQIPVVRAFSRRCGVADFSCRYSVPHIRSFQDAGRNFPRWTIDNLCSGNKLAFNHMAHACRTHSELLSCLFRRQCLRRS
jgi:hypothetical protein